MADFDRHLRDAQAPGASPQPAPEPPAGGLPLGCKRYKMGTLAFVTDAEPEQLLSEALGRLVKGLVQAGEFGAARSLQDNPDPFAGEPCAKALFMLTATAVSELREENVELRRRLEALEDAR